MKKGLFILLILIIIFGGLFLCIFPDPINSYREVTINRFDKNLDLYFLKRPRQGSIHGLSLEVSGHIAGKVLFIKAYSKNSYDITDTLTNDINLSYGGDWYQDTCYILLRPLTCKTGDIKIKYRFYGTNNL